MNLLSKVGSAASACALALSFMLAAPLAYASKDFYNCNGPGTVKIVFDGKDYWYVQNGKVCGRRQA